MPRRRRDQDPLEVEIRLGQATDCPQCGSLGFIDWIDLRARTMRQICRNREHEWELAEGERITAQE
jgi:hypothetical protein